MTQPDRLERVTRRLMRAGRHALHAQERYYYWVQFKTNSPTARRASAKLDKALEDLSRVEADVEEALLPYNRG